MSTGPKTNSSILLVCGHPELQYHTLLENSGFKVVNVRGLPEAILHWRPSHFDLVLIVVDGELDESLAFCEGLKKLDPKQNIAFVTGWHTYVPPLSCPDDVIQQEYNPARFLKRVTELVQPQ